MVSLLSSMISLEKGNFLHSPLAWEYLNGQEDLDRIVPHINNQLVTQVPRTNRKSIAGLMGPNRGHQYTQVTEPTPINPQPNHLTWSNNAWVKKYSPVIGSSCHMLG